MATQGHKTVPGDAFYYLSGLVCVQVDYYPPRFSRIGVDVRFQEALDANCEVDEQRHKARGAAS